MKVSAEWMRLSCPDNFSVLPWEVCSLCSSSWVVQGMWYHLLMSACTLQFRMEKEYYHISHGC